MHGVQSCFLLKKSHMEYIQTHCSYYPTSKDPSPMAWAMSLADAAPTLVRCRILGAYHAAPTTTVTRTSFQPIHEKHNSSVRARFDLALYTLLSDSAVVLRLCLAVILRNALVRTDALHICDSGQISRKDDVREHHSLYFFLQHDSVGGLWNARRLSFLPEAKMRA